MKIKIYLAIDQYEKKQIYEKFNEISTFSNLIKFSDL